MTKKRNRDGAIALAIVALQQEAESLERRAGETRALVKQLSNHAAGAAIVGTKQN